MSNAIEIEAKVLLTQDQYKVLVNQFRGNRRYMQTNYYIDSEDGILAKNGIVLRIREKSGIYELTLKTPLSEGLLEKNTLINIEDFAALRDFEEFPKGDTARFLTMLDIDVTTLRILTSLSTERIDVDYENGLLSIDRNVYSGKTDFEIEFEYNSMEKAKEILSNLLKEHGIECVFNEQSKIRRAMAAIGR